MQRCVLVILMAGLLAGADSSTQAETKTDQDGIQGTWQGVSAEKQGQKAPEERVKAIQMIISADRFIFKRDDQTHVARYRIDPTRNPKQIDVIPADGSGKGKTSVGIYKLEGDTLTLCTSPPGEPRPTEFASGPKSRESLIVLRREKPR